MKNSSPTVSVPATAAGPMRFSPAEFWRMFKERWVTGLFIGLAAAALIFYFQPEQTAAYHTEAYLLFAPKKDRIINIPDVVDTSVGSGAELHTHLEQLRSKTFLEYLFSSFTPDEIKRIQAPYLDPRQPESAPPSLAKIIQPNVNVFTRKGTSIVGIGVNNRDPENAALIANRYARKYIDYNIERAISGANSANIFLRNQADDLRRQVGAAENDLQDYRAQHNRAALDETQNVVVQKLGSLGTTLVRTQMEIIELQALLDNIGHFKKAGRPLIEIHQVLASNQVGQAKNKLEELRAARLLLEQRYLARHPKIKENDLATREMQRVLDENIAKAVADFRTRLDVDVQYEKQLQSEIKATQAMARELDKISVDYRFLEQEVANKRDAYAKITNRMNEISIGGQMEDINIKVFDTAWIPVIPAEDAMKNPFILGGAAILGALILIPFGLGFCDTRIKTAAHVETMLGQHLLGVLPRLKQSTSAERAQAFLLDKDNALTESYRGLYSEIEIASTLTYPKSLLIASSVPNEGKSLIASNLAAVFSSHGRRTLLVDADLRRPVLHHYFQVSGKTGWIQWLQQPAAERPALPTAIVNLAPRLDLLPAGAIPSNCTQLLEQLAHAGIQKQLLSAYDLVIFDTPPATVFPDALLLARSCHELIYVCLFSRVRLHTVKRALAHLCTSGVHSLGIILNQMPAGGNGHYIYGSQSAKYYKTYATRDMN